MLRWFYVLAHRVAERKEKRDITGEFAKLKATDELSPDQINRLQQTRLTDILVYARQKIPYYAQMFAERDFDPATSDMDSFHCLPFLSKDTIREIGPERLCNSNLPLVARKTGGSTGPKLIVSYDPKGLDITAAAHRRCLRWAGKKPGEKEVHFSSDLGVPISEIDRRREYWKCFSLNRENILINIYDEQKMQAILDQLRRVKPVLVQGYPSMAYNLAKYVETRPPDKRVRFRIYEATGETLLDFQRAKIEEVFQCEVYDRFGNAEFGVVAHECRAHQGLHIFSDIVYVESIRDEVSQGLPELVVTGLTNQGMPLIRYRTGDLGEITWEPCRCGLPYPRIINLQGRVHDLIQLEEGKVMSTELLLDIMDRCGGMDDFQIAENGNRIEIHVLPDQDCNLDRLADMQSRFVKLGQIRIKKLDIIVVKKLQLTSAGKFRYRAESIANQSLMVLKETECGTIYECQ